MDHIFENKIFFKHYISKKLEIAFQDNFNSFRKILIFHSYFLFLELNLTSKAINQIIQLKNQTSSFFEYHSLRRLEIRVRNHLTAKNRIEGLNLEKMVKIEQLNLKLESNITNYISLQENLLLNLHKKILNISQLKKLCERLVKVYEHIWAVRSSKFGINNPELLTTMISFFMAIMNNTSLAKKLQSSLEICKERILNYEKREQVFYEEELMYNSQSSMIQIGGMKANLGEIIFVNKGFERLFKYDKKELIGKNINIILPEDLGNFFSHKSKKPSKFLIKLYRNRKKQNFVQRT